MDRSNNKSIKFGKPEFQRDMSKGAKTIQIQTNVKNKIGQCKDSGSKICKISQSQVSTTQPCHEEVKQASLSPKSNVSLIRLFIINLDFNKTKKQS